MYNVSVKISKTENNGIMERHDSYKDIEKIVLKGQSHSKISNSFYDVISFTQETNETTLNEELSIYNGIEILITEIED